MKSELALPSSSSRSSSPCLPCRRPVLKRSQHSRGYRRPGLYMRLRGWRGRRECLPDVGRALEPDRANTGSADASADWRVPCRFEWWSDTCVCSTLTRPCLARSAALGCERLLGAPGDDGPALKPESQRSTRTCEAGGAVENLRCHHGLTPHHLGLRLTAARARRRPSSTRLGTSSSRQCGTAARRPPTSCC